jgi:sugar/nucleoside kinase (ribokinase family)
LPAFSKEQLLEALDAATYLILNEYEFELLLQMTEMTEDNLLGFVDAYIITL